MKRLILIGALFVPALANAELVYVQAGEGHQCAGDKFPITAPMEVLYQDRSCELPLLNAKDMRAYGLHVSRSNEPSRKNPGANLRGCWGKTIEGSYYVIREDGSQNTFPPNSLASASLLKTGMAIVIKNPNQDTAYSKALGVCP